MPDHHRDVTAAHRPDARGGDATRQPTHPPAGSRAARPPRTAPPWGGLRHPLPVLVTALLTLLLTAIGGSVPGGPAAADVPAVGPSLRGVLERLAVEEPAADRAGPRPSGEISAWLRTGDSRVPIEPDAVSGVPTGAWIEVRLVPAPAGGVRRVLSVTVLSRDGARSVPPVAAAAAPHTVTAVLALPPGAHADGMPAARLRAAITTGVSRFWSASSGGRITFTVTRAIGWQRLTSSCADIWNLWDEVRLKSGFTPGARRHLLVYTPPGSGCPNGLGTVAPTADTGGYVLVGGVTTGLLAHELGHNLGLGHSDALTCAGSPEAAFTGRWPENCTHDDYGDWYDVMGISWDHLGTLSTAHAYRLGLLPPGTVLSVSGPARAVLRPVSAMSGLRSLRITDPGGAVYVVEYRPAAGRDAWIGTAGDWRGLRPGVLVRRIDPQDPTRTLLLDATPSGIRGAATAPVPDWDRPLSPGQSLRTASGRVTIRVESQVAGAAAVAVDVDGVRPAVVVAPGGRLVGGAQVTVGEAPAAWAAAASTGH